jgi:hypothetical protein
MTSEAEKTNVKAADIAFDLCNVKCGVLFEVGTEFLNII